MITKIGREIGIRDDHKYTVSACPKCGKERWVKLSKQNTKCYSCSRPRTFLGELTPERRNNISDGQKRRISRDGKPDWMGRSMVGENNPMFGRTQTIESIEKNRASNKKNWNNPEFQRKWMLANTYPHIKQTKPEKELEIALRGLVEFVGDGSFWIGYPPRNPDFIHREHRKIIEFFGNYWHKPEDEQDRIDHYKQYGWDCFVVWEDDYNNNKELALTNIKEFIE